MSSERAEARVIASATISAVLPAPPELAFEVLTEPQHLLQWWGRYIGYKPERITADLRPGGEYEIVMRKDDGSSYRIFGVYEKLEKPHALSCSWSFQRIDAAGAAGPVTVDTSLLEATLSPHPGGCEVVLHHTKLPDAKECASVAEGWSGVFALASAYILRRTELPDHSEDELNKLPNSSVRSLRLETDISAAQSEIWKWLTHADLLTRWFPQRAETDPCHGGYYRFFWDSSSKGLHMKQGNFTFCSVNHVLVYDWYPWGFTHEGMPKGPEPPEAETRVKWSLEKLGDGVHVVLEHSGWRAGHDWDELLKGHAAGWELYLRNLKSVIEGGPDLRSQ
jgi:uncharacterized protein YndB with AHSA1/START domain